jgi:hypothetical protein
MSAVADCDLSLFVQPLLYKTSPRVNTVVDFSIDHVRAVTGRTDGQTDTVLITAAALN